MEFLKTVLGKVVAVLVAVFLVLLSVKTGVESLKTYKESHEYYKNTIVVSAEDKVIGVPDIAQMNFTVISKGATVAVASNDNTKKMNAVLAAVKSMGVEEKDIRTTSYYLDPEYNYDTDPSKIVGYRAEQGLEVKVRAKDKAGEILQKATTAGANQVGQIYFTIDDPEQLKSQAREKAFNKAKEKAQTLARQAGVRLGKVINFSDDQGGYYPPMPYYGNEMGGGGYDKNYDASATDRSFGAQVGAPAPSAPPAPVLQPGSQEVTAYVTMTYEIY
ncbi:MAG: SIMPL domain-containing protein [Candidatus Abawacabacteria bacterium]|nr:SIMPL domain-containing protein [Candidatus Abawacabacteria bacterium]